jgi:hypothetical protein
MAPRTHAAPRERSLGLLDLPKELRIMVYENLVLRRHHKIQFYVPDYSTLQFTLVLSDPVPLLHRTCRLLHAEMAHYVLPFVVPRIILNRYLNGCRHTYRAWLVVKEFIEIIHRVHRSGKLTVKKLQENYKLEVATHRCPYGDYRHRFATDNYEVITRFGNVAGSYVYRQKLPTCATGYVLQISIPGASENAIGSFRRKWDEQFECSKGLGVEASLLTLEPSPVQESFTSNGLRYGGSIDQKTWDMEWAET